MSCRDCVACKLYGRKPKVPYFRKKQIPERPCIICTNPLYEPYVLDCMHMYHKLCILRWFRTGSNTCPLCRTPSHSPEINYSNTREIHGYFRLDEN